jgi:hypothetical protein
MTAEEKLQSVMAGREGRDYGPKKAKREKKGGTTNEVKVIIWHYLQYSKN